MQVFPIASSSDGNCTIVRSNGTSVLIDCGISLRTITDIFGRDNLKSIAALFVTHEHSDHVKGIPVLARRLPDLPVYVHEKSFRARRALFAGANVQNLDPSRRIDIGSFEVTAFATHHDSKSSHGFFIFDRYSGLNLCYIPDTGHICPVIKGHAKAADILFIECDYDEKMLADYPHYPDELKERISGPHGHLSNRNALDLVEEIGIDRFQKIILTHLSPRTNSPEVLMGSILKRFGEDHCFEIAGRTGLRSTSKLAL
jgi:phosphoribosyl 1,2-cyclic phosphodiesterase